MRGIDNLREFESKNIKTEDRPLKNTTDNKNEIDQQIDDLEESQTKLEKIDSLEDLTKFAHSFLKGIGKTLINSKTKKLNEID